MLARVFREAVRGNLVAQINSRSIVTSSKCFKELDVTQDIALTSPRPSLTYPDQSLDQYIWNDFSRWGKKIAIVSCISENFQDYPTEIVSDRWLHRSLADLRSIAWQMPSLGRSPSHITRPQIWRHHRHLLSQFDWVSSRLLGWEWSWDDCDHDQFSLYRWWVACPNCSADKIRG